MSGNSDYITPSHPATGRLLRSLAEMISAPTPIRTGDLEITINIQALYTIK